MSEKAISITGTAFVALVLAYFKALAVPVIMLAVLMLLDYISGVIEAWVHNTMSSRVGIIGIVKKLCYALVVVVAVAIDLVIQYAAGQVGFDLTGVYCFGLLVTIWLIFNESISILENVAEIGGPEVPFLGKLLKHLKNTTEKKAEEAIPEETDEHGEEPLQENGGAGDD